MTDRERQTFRDVAWASLLLLTRNPHLTLIQRYRVVVMAGRIS